MKHIIAAALALFATLSQAQTTACNVSALSLCGNGTVTLNCNDVPLNPVAPLSVKEVNNTLVIDIDGTSVVIPANPNNSASVNQPAPVAMPGTYRKAIVQIPRSFNSNQTYWIDGAGGITGIFTLSVRGPYCGSYLHSYYSMACAKVYMTGGTFTVQQ
jgi:hypothetical protein